MATILDPSTGTSDWGGTTGDDVLVYKGGDDIVYGGLGYDILRIDRPYADVVIGEIYYDPDPDAPLVGPKDIYPNQSIPLFIRNYSFPIDPDFPSVYDEAYWGVVANKVERIEFRDYSLPLVNTSESSPQGSPSPSSQTNSQPNDGEFDLVTGILKVANTSPGIWKKKGMVDLNREFTFLKTKGKGNKKKVLADADCDSYEWSELQGAIKQIQFIGDASWSASQSREGVAIYSNSKNNVSAFIYGMSVNDLDGIAQSIIS